MSLAPRLMRLQKILGQHINFIFPAKNSAIDMMATIFSLD
jgi:hypothetical protein